MCDSARTTSSSGGLETKPVVPYVWPGCGARARASRVCRGGGCGGGNGAVRAPLPVHANTSGAAFPLVRRDRAGHRFRSVRRFYRVAIVFLFFSFLVFVSQNNTVVYVYTLHPPTRLEAIGNIFAVCALDKNKIKKFQKWNGRWSNKIVLRTQARRKTAAFIPVSTVTTPPPRLKANNEWINTWKSTCVTYWKPIDYYSYGRFLNNF